MISRIDFNACVSVYDDHFCFSRFNGYDYDDVNPLP